LYQKIQNITSAFPLPFTPLKLYTATDMCSRLLKLLIYLYVWKPVAT